MSPPRSCAHRVVVTGASGYLGRALSRALLDRGHTVLGVARPASVARLERGVTPIAGDVLDAASYAGCLVGADTLVHLVGTTADGARRLGLVTLAQVTRALVAAVERPARGVAVFDVEAIRAVESPGPIPIRAGEWRGQNTASPTVPVADWKL